MAQFEFKPTAMEESTEFAVDKIQFGDGYSQRIGKGLNNGLRQWSVSFKDLSKADADAMILFFRVRFGSTSFTWRPIGFDADIRVVCVSYSRPIENRFKDGQFTYSISARFEEVAL